MRRLQPTPSRLAASGTASPSMPCNDSRERDTPPRHHGCRPRDRAANAAIRHRGGVRAAARRRQRKVDEVEEEDGGLGMERGQFLVAASATRLVGDGRDKIVNA